MTINVAELRQHLAWFDEHREVVAVDEAGQRFDITAVDEAAGEVRLVVRVTAA